MLFWRERSINKQVDAGYITKQKAIWCLEEALRLHNAFVRALAQPELTTVDEDMREWDVWTTQVLDLIEDGHSKMVTKKEAIDRMFKDAETHQWYIDNPSYATGAYGDVAWHIKWRDRWLAVAKLIEEEY